MIGENSTITFGVLFVILAAAFVLWRWIAGSLRLVESDARAGRDAVRTMLEERILKLEQKEADFELEVAKHYASDDRLQNMEEKFTASIEKLINRFDAFATDFHRIVGRLERDAERPGE